MPKRTDVAALGERLLDAHVAFELARILDSTDFENTVVDEVDHFLAMADELTLADAISADPVKDVARKYAVQIPVEGAIPELVGEIARALYRHGTGGQYRLADVIDDRHFDELATAISEMGLTRRLVRQVLEGPATIETAVEVVTRAVDSLLDDPDDEPAPSDLAARVRERTVHGLRGAVRPARPVIDSVVERVTRSSATFVLRGNEQEAGELLLESVRDVWRNNRDASLGAFRDLVTEEDVDDIIVLVFEFWREFRSTPFVHMLLDDAVGLEAADLRLVYDPALLEWDAPGRYHARLYPITPAMTRRVLVTYTQWLTPRSDGGRTYRLPLASLGTRIGELRADIDLTRAGATEVRASAGSRRPCSATGAAPPSPCLRRARRAARTRGRAGGWPRRSSGPRR